MHPPKELGRLVSSHVPIHPTMSVVLCSLPGLVIGLGLWLGAVDSPGVGVLAYVLTTTLLVALFSESLFVRQLVFEHGLLLTSIVPLTPRYAIPYAAIDPDSIEALPYRRPQGAADITDAFSRRYRQAPFVGAVSFVGVSPRIAADLARGRTRWDDAIESADELPEHLWNRSGEFERWYVSVRDNTRAADDLRRRVADASSKRQT